MKLDTLNSILNNAKKIGIATVSELQKFKQIMFCKDNADLQFALMKYRMELDDVL